MTERSSRQPDSKSLAEIIGCEVDPMAYWSAILPTLEGRGISLEEFAWHEVARHDDVVQKTAKHGARAPVSPLLPEISSRISQAVVVGDMPTAQLLEHLAYFKREVEEARDFYES